jgi:hypothetical protein
VQFNIYLIVTLVLERIMSKIIKTFKNAVTTVQQIINEHYGRTDYITRVQKGITPIFASVMFYYTYR